MDLREARRLIRVGPKASAREINATWRRLVLKAHPDLRPQEEREAATAVTAKLNEARRLLLEQAGLTPLEERPPRNLMVELAKRWSADEVKIHVAVVEDMRAAYRSAKEAVEKRRDLDAAVAATLAEAYGQEAAEEVAKLAFKKHGTALLIRLQREHAYAKRCQERWLLQVDEEESALKGEGTGKVWWGPREEEAWGRFLKWGLQDLSDEPRSAPPAASAGAASEPAGGARPQGQGPQGRKRGAGTWLILVGCCLLANKALIQWSPAWRRLVGIDVPVQWQNLTLTDRGRIVLSLLLILGLWYLMSGGLSQVQPNIARLGR